MTTLPDMDFVLVFLGLPIPAGKLKPEPVWECQQCFALVKRPEHHWNVRHRTIADRSVFDRVARIEPA